VKDEEADGERALPRGARHPADYVTAFQQLRGYITTWLKCFVVTTGCSFSAIGHSNRRSVDCDYGIRKLIQTKEALEVASSVS
jgi:hypothetical protein